MEQEFIQLTIILLTAFILAYIARLLKQPIVIGYIVAGIIISPFIIKFGASTEMINLFSKFGIALLLFIVGLHLNPKTIKEIGASSLVVGLAQIVFTFGVAFLVSLTLLHLNVVSSAYVGIALSFSSTIIIMKLFSDKQDLDSLYSKISIGILILQDLVAIAVLIFISTVSGEADLVGFTFKGAMLGIGLLVVLSLFGLFVLPRFTKSLAKSQELLFLFSIAWCFLIASLFSYLGFSIEIGALIAGIALSISPYSVEISSKMRPLRDFFLVIFFIILGLNTQFSNLGPILLNAIVLSLIVLIVKPIITMAFLALFKYTKRTNFLVGTTLAQISEFSLIILLLGVSLGQVNSEVLYTVILTMIITIFILLT
jgi:Kef-type K+ transport system membrane component KefB